MTTARERASEVARSYVNQDPESRQEAARSADRASDVWEPLVRDLCEALADLLQPTRPEKKALDAGMAALKRGEVATGDRDPRLDALVAYLDKKEATPSTAALAEILIAVMEGVDD